MPTLIDQLDWALNRRIAPGRVLIGHESGWAINQRFGLLTFDADGRHLTQRGQEVQRTHPHLIEQLCGMLDAEAHIMSLTG